jgi:hypothetical protein
MCQYQEANGLEFRGYPPPKLSESENTKGANIMMLNGVQFSYTKHAQNLSVEALEKLQQLVDGKGEVDPKFRTVC